MKVPEFCRKNARRVLPAAVVVLTFALLTIAVTWPLVTQLDTSLAQNPHWSRDAYQQAYEMWWFKKALLEGKSPGTLSWIYFPDGADYPLLLTYFTTYVVGVPFLLFLSPTATYNVVFLLTFFLSGLTAYALCAHLTQNRWAGLLGGIIYAFFPGRVAHALAGHLELIAIYLFPLYLLLLIKTVRQPRPLTAALCGLTLGASLLVQPLFIPFLLVPFTAIWLLCEVFLLKRKVGRRAWLALTGALSLGAITAAPFFWPVLSQQTAGRGSYLRGIGTVSFSADLLGVVAPSPVNPVLGRLGIVPPYVHRVAPNDWRIAELLIYVGLVPLVLGTLAAVKHRRQVAAWVLVAILAAVLSLGPVLKVNGEVVSFTTNEVGGSREITVALPYALLTNLPLLALNRAPARINTTLMLALAVLSAYGLAWLTERVRQRWRVALTVALCAFTLVELSVIWPFPTMPVQTPAYLAEIAKSDNEGAILNLPIAAGHVKQLSVFQQTIHEHPVFDSWFQRDLPVLPNVAGFLDGLLTPETQADIVPTPRPGDRAAVARAEGAGYVFLHTPYVGDAEAKMQLLETEFGPPRSTEEGIAIYEVAPGPTVASDLVYTVPNNDWRSSERGWHYVEEWAGHPARWMAGSAELYIYSSDRREGALQFRALPLAAPQRLQIEINREPLPPLVIGEWITYTTSSVTLQPGLNQITLHALGGCTPYVGDPRCGGVTRGVAGEDAGCSRYIQGRRCLAMLFQDVRFTKAVDQSLEVDLGDQIRLLAYNLILPLPGGELEGGRHLALTLYWQALHPPKDDYTVFVHLLDSGNLVAQHDGLPLDGVYPTSEWIVGDTFTQQIKLTIPPDAPSGTYDLMVGMYTYPDIVRLPVAGDRPYAQDGLVWLQAVEIE